MPSLQDCVLTLARRFVFYKGFELERRRIAFILFCPFNTVRIPLPITPYTPYGTVACPVVVQARLALRRLQDNIEPIELYCICAAGCLPLRLEHSWAQIARKTLHT